MLYEVPIEAGKIREFAVATHTDNPDYRAAAAPVPPTFLATAGTFWEPPGEPGISQLDFELARVLHGEEEYIFYGPPPRAGQTLQVTGRLGDRVEKQGKRGGVMRIAKVIHEFRDASGMLVAEQHTTVIETAVAPSTS